MSRERIERWEAGKERPTPPELRALGDIYDAPAPEIERWIEVVAEPGETDDRTRRAALRRANRAVAPPAAPPPSQEPVPVIRVNRPEPAPPRAVVVPVVPIADRRTSFVRGLFVVATLALFGLILVWSVGALIQMV